MTLCYWCGYPVDPDVCITINEFEEQPGVVAMPIKLHWECFYEMGRHYRLKIRKDIKDA
jgi:hypothetical protein